MSSSASTPAVDDDDKYPYKCRLDIAFPCQDDADKVKRVLEVDEEVGDRVLKSFSLAASSPSADTKTILCINFQATEAKMLRVAISTFYDYLTVSLKCLQEFSDA